MKSGMATGARLISPYYPLLLPLLLCRPGLQSLVRTRWWRVAELSAMAIAIPVVALTPARPLWPATTVLQRLATAHPQQKLLSRAFDVYSVYAGRADPLARVRALLPPDLDRVGFMARGDDPDISFWRPFGSRRVVHLLVQDQPAFIKSLGLRYAIVGDINFSLQNTSFEEWRNRVGAELVSTVEATVKVSEGPQRWYIVRFSN
jgi:hypothetical protein